MSGRRRGGRGRRRCTTVWTAERPCTHTRVRRRAHLNLRGTQTSFHARADARDAQSGCLGGDLIMVTPIEDQQHGDGRLWMPGEMSIQNSDTHLVATSIAISGARHSTRCLCQRQTPPLPLYLCEAAASAK